MTNAIAHPNVSLIQQLDLANLAASPHLFAKNFIWHSSNPKLRDVQGDYVGIKGVKIFFKKLRRYTSGTFWIELISLVPIGDELVVAHAVDHMQLDGVHVELDAVVIWRVVDGLISEAWDIPSLYVNRTEALETEMARKLVDFAA